MAVMSLKQTPPSLLAKSALLHKEGEKSKQKYPESTMVTVVCTEKGCSFWSIGRFCSNDSFKERCCGWLSATTEEYTVTDHIWTHGVSFQK